MTHTTGKIDSKGNVRLKTVGAIPYQSLRIQRGCLRGMGRLILGPSIFAVRMLVDAIRTIWRQAHG